MNKVASIVLIAMLMLFVVQLLIFSIFRLWEVDISVPFIYWGDTLWQMVPIKSISLNGWVYHVPQLSAPFSLSVPAFPMMNTVDWVFMWMIASITDSGPGTILNSFYLLSMSLTALTAFLSFILIGQNKWMSASLAIVYALLPYVFIRTAGHINLVYYLVPLVGLYAINLASGYTINASKRTNILGLVSSVLIGFNYIYYSFFAAGLLIFSGLLGSWVARSRVPVSMRR